MMAEERTWVADGPPLAENFRSYEQRRADDPMIVLEEETMAWQPIETAKRNGTKADLWTSRGRFVDCFWDGEWWAWVDKFGTERQVNAELITHWMTPPVPP